MTDAELYAWHLAPVCDAFSPSGGYPPPVEVNPAHVGYKLQRHVKGCKLGEVVVGMWRLDTAEDLCRLLNTDRTHPRVSQLRVVERYI